MKIIILFLSFIFASSAFAISGNDAKTYMEREPQRKQYASSVAAATEKNLNAIRGNSSGSGVNKTIQQQINSHATASDGSRVSGSGSVTKPVDPAAVSKTTVGRLSRAKALAKASLPSFLGSAALTALIHGIGWVMDEGSGAILKPADGSPLPYSKWNVSGTTYYGTTPKNAVIPYFDSLNLEFNHCSKDGVSYLCYYKSGNDYAGGTLVVPDTSSPPYDPANDVVAVSNAELENTINNYITNNDNSVTNNIINNAYSYDSSNGASPSDSTNGLAVDAHNDIAVAINKAATAPYNANNPKKGYYMITDGTKTVEGYVDASAPTGATETDTKSDTVTNPDGSQTTTGQSSSEFKLPAFCSWASVVCDWLDWTKEMPEDEPEQEQPQVDDKGIFARTFDNVFSLSGECPADLPITFNIMEYQGNFKINMNWLCIFFTFIGYPLVFTAHCMGFWVLYETVTRKEIKW